MIDEQMVDFGAISHTEHACGDSGKKQLPGYRKKPGAEPELDSVSQKANRCLILSKVLT